MEKTNLSPYRYLTFLLPGGFTLFVAIYGWTGWPYGEPGAGAILGLSVAAFMAGHALAGVANWLQPIWWGHAPGSRVSSSEGLFDKGSRYVGNRAQVERAFEAAYGKLSGFEARFGVAYTEAQTGPLGPKLLAFVEEIGFYRSMASATLLGSILVAVFNGTGRHHLPLLPWIPMLLAATVLYALRFRRFWRYVGEYVVGEVLRRRDETVGGSS